MSIILHGFNRFSGFGHSFHISVQHYKLYTNQLQFVSSYSFLHQIETNKTADKLKCQLKKRNEPVCFLQLTFELTCSVASCSGHVDAALSTCLDGAFHDSGHLVAGEPEHLARRRHPLLPWGLPNEIELDRGYLFQVVATRVVVDL